MNFKQYTPYLETYMRVKQLSEQTKKLHLKVINMLYSIADPFDKPIVFIRFIEAKPSITYYSIIKNIIYAYPDWTEDEKLKLIKQIPKPRKKRTNVLYNYLSEEEIEKLIQYYKSKEYLNRRYNRPLMYLFVWFGFRTGLRIEDILNVRPINFDWKKSILRLVMLKTNRPVVLYIDDMLINEIKMVINMRNIADQQRIFDGKYHHYYQSLKKAGKRILQKRVTPHTLRHSFAVWIMEKSRDLELTQKLLGHANISNTARYTEVITDIYTDRQAEIYAKMNLIKTNNAGGVNGNK